ncbi:hypothetical protein CWI38_0967p0020 [Hamiltosporidium tvaerminnensis]|uniref:Uncharacterized protein n=1 Tax=Hamiltosporidium tvaerminnensis TaxID=1176355 RepID=A0A4Q9LTV2_9MICR|nr:hypothetical protein CWI38_0967p0020 [Hamiltosporidium tvaerminnensis]
MSKFGILDQIYLFYTREAGITSHYSLQIIEIEELRNYGLLPNELGLIYKCKIPMNVEAYIQTIVHKKKSKCSYDKGENGLNIRDNDKAIKEMKYFLSHE